MTLDLPLPLGPTTEEKFCEPHGVPVRCSQAGIGECVRVLGKWSLHVLGTGVVVAGGRCGNHAGSECFTVEWLDRDSLADAVAGKPEAREGGGDSLTALT